MLGLGLLLGVFFFTMKMQIKTSFTEEEELWEVTGRKMSNKMEKKERQ